MSYSEGLRADNPKYGETRHVKYGSLGDMPATNDVQIEYIVVAFDDEHKEVKLSLRQADILEALGNDEELVKQGGGVPGISEGNHKAPSRPAPTFHPEFGRFMLESTPGKPWV